MKNAVILTPQARGLLPALALLLSFLALPILGRAQTASNADQKKSDDVVTLSEFNVAAENDNSYMPAESTTGARVATRIQDLPYAVNVMTSEFIQDLSIFDLTEDLSYMSSISGNDDSASFTVRGFTGANTYLRNGFPRLGLIDAPNVDRIELIKGPAGAIYGQTNPGGALNVTTKRPKSHPFQKISASYGSYDLNQSSFELSGPLSPGRWFDKGQPKLFYLVGGTYYHRGYDEPSQRRMTKSITGTIVYKPTENTDISIDVNGQSFKNPNEWGLPYIVDPTGKRYLGYAYEIAKKHYASPVDWKGRNVWGYEGIIEHRFNRYLSMNAGYNFYSQPIVTYDTVRSSTYDPTTRSLIGRSATPAWSTIYGKGHSYEVTLLGHYPVFNTDQKTLFTIDDYANNRGDYSTTAIAGTYTPIPKTLSVDAPVYEDYIPQDRNHFTWNTTRDNLVDTTGFSLAQQSFFLNKRLISMVVFRHDYVRGDLRSPGPPPGPTQSAKIHDSNDATRIGVSYQIVPELSVYVERAESFIPFGTSVAIGTSPPSETGLGYETGFKGNFGDRFSFTTDVFTTHRKNVSVNELSNPNDPSSPTISIPEGDQKSKGFEVDGLAHITKDLQLTLSYSYLDSRLSNQGINIYANGKRPRAVPYNSIAGTLRYEIAKGLSVVLSMRYTGNTPAESPSTGLSTVPGSKLLTISDGRADLRTPAFAVWNIGTSYRWKSEWQHLSQRVNVTAKNIFDREYIVPGNNRFYGDRFGVYVTYSIEH
ncbi:MAG TPA: TonB-dependent receptor [Opitutaceae bacterium]|nr:TonB-dependent receptor [Opitutaceae bacterium]